MNADLVIGIILGLVTLVLVVSETHVAFVTLALASGYVLSDTLADNLASGLGSLVDIDTNTLDAVSRIFLLLLPAVIVALRFRRTQRGLGRHIQQAVPSFALSLVALWLVFQNLPFRTQSDLVGDSYLASNAVSYGELLVAFAIATSLFDVVFQHQKGHDGRKSKKGKKGGD